MLLRSLADVRTSVEVTDEPETAGLGGHKGLACPRVRPLSDITAKFHPLGSFENPNYKRSGPNSFPAELPWQQQLLRNLVQLLVGTGREGSSLSFTQVSPSQQQTPKRIHIFHVANFRL